jgi:hypothetical protein
MARDLASWHCGVATKNGLIGDLQTRGKHSDLLRRPENIENGAIGCQMVASVSRCSGAPGLPWGSATVAGRMLHPDLAVAP